MRISGDTKTEKSLRTLKLPPEVVGVLKEHRVSQIEDRLAAGELWHETPRSTGVWDGRLFFGSLDLRLII